MAKRTITVAVKITTDIVVDVDDFDSEQQQRKAIETALKSSQVSNALEDSIIQQVILYRVRGGIANSINSWYCESLQLDDYFGSATVRN